MKQLTDIYQQEVIDYTVVNETKKSIGSSFFRGESCNFNPYQIDFVRDGFLNKFMLGWAPGAPVISSQTKVTAFGSCFAANIAKHLSAAGFNLNKDRHPDIYVSEMGEGLVNIHSIYQQFAWALEGIEPPKGLWHGFKAEEFGYSEKVRERTRAAFLETEFFIITLGLSEVWYDSETGGIFWRAVPRAQYDESRHKFRVCSFEETKAGIADIYRSIRTHIPNAKVLFTLSPVPLAATFRPVSCITANSASKAILRAALDEFLRDSAQDVGDSLFYFPSYEIINDLFFARFGEDGRHPHQNLINFIMKAFEAFFCETGELSNIDSSYRAVRRVNGEEAARVGSLSGN